MQQNWLGLRPEDLGDQERSQLERDLQLSAIHRAELTFGQNLERLPYSGRVIVFDDIRTYAERMGPFAKKRKSMTWLYGLPLVGIVFGMLLILALTNNRGKVPAGVKGITAPQPEYYLVGEPEAISLTGWAVQATGERPLVEGEDIQVNENLGLQVSVKGSGHVVVGDLDRGQRLFPMDDLPLFFEEGAYKVGRQGFEFFDFSSRVGRVKLRAVSCVDPMEGWPAMVPQGCVVADFEFQVAGR